MQKMNVNQTLEWIWKLFIKDQYRKLLRAVGAGGWEENWEILHTTDHLQAATKLKYLTAYHTGTMDDRKMSSIQLGN